jgi:unsaturated rhamnogalacturonyl hydrolase
VKAVATTWSRRAADAVARRLPVLDTRWDYKWGVVAKGLLEVWSASGDRRYLDHVKRSVDEFVAADGSIRTYDRGAFSLDFINPGKVLFALLRETGDPRYRAALELLRDQLRDQPRAPSGSFWHKQVFPDQMWLDGVYMASPFLAEYAATFDEPAIFDDVVRQIVLAFEHARDERTGLLFHAVDESRTQPWADARTGCSRSFWARAVGWYAMALVDVLDVLAEDAQRETVVAILRRTMDAIVRVQDGSGLWWQVLDQGGRGRNYLEESASAMFAYALAKGSRQGHLPGEHRRLALRAYDAIVERFVRATADGAIDVTGCCVGTGLGGTLDRDGSFEYYADRPVATNDHHGVGAFLLASVEIERAAVR